MLTRELLLAAACRPVVGRRLLRRFVAGESTAEAVGVLDRLIARGLQVSVEHLGAESADPAQADAVRDEYLALLARLGAAGTGGRAEVAVALSALGSGLRPDGRRAALERARAVCAAAEAAGAAVTLDRSAPWAVDDTLDTAAELRADFPRVGVVLRSCLRRTEADCRELLHTGTRVRLVKGRCPGAERVAFRGRGEVDRSFVRCLRLLMEGHGHPMVATDDPRLIEIAGALAVRAGRPQQSYEFQLPYGVRPDEQRRLAAAGEAVRVTVPYGQMTRRALRASH
ncbi:proline dehydrogenase family protein [Streptacidiphilus sp. PAMC 29251]